MSPTGRTGRHEYEKIPTLANARITKMPRYYDVCVMHCYSILCASFSLKTQNGKVKAKVDLPTRLA